jgi:hypothetical protein
MTDQEAYEEKMGHFTALIKQLLTELPGNYKADPVLGSGHIYKWRIYRVESPGLIYILDPDPVLIISAYNQTLEQQREILNPFLDGAIKALKGPA